MATSFFMKYTIVYITNRLEPLLHWTLDSLALEIPADERSDVQFVVVDKYGDDLGRKKWVRFQLVDKLDGCKFVHTTVKPNVWCGKHRLTSADYFAASNYRNTGILLAEAPHIAFLDDLSVVCGGWWDHVKQSNADQEVYLGTYDKHRHMYVDQGVLLSSDPHSIAEDTRRQKLQPGTKDPIPCTGSWMYGCSFACPTEALLQVNGFDEDCDSMGSEDYITGILMEKKGWKFKFCQGMKTIESDYHHELGKIAVRVIKPMGDTDASHVVLNSVMNGSKVKSSFYSNKYSDIREARDYVLQTGKLPECSIPEHDWRDGTLISKMG
jgi:hypothetical protein